MSLSTFANILIRETSRQTARTHPKDTQDTERHAVYQVLWPNILL